MHWSAVAQDLLREGYKEGYEIDREEAPIENTLKFLNLLDDQTISKTFQLPPKKEPSQLPL